jgi:hypothetical protein
MWGIGKWGDDIESSGWCVQLAYGEIFSSNPEGWGEYLFPRRDRPIFKLACGNGIYQVVCTTEVDIGGWTHVAAVRSGDELRIYLDGELQTLGHVGDFSVNATENNVRINRGSNGDNIPSADYDELCIFKNVALSQSQIQYLVEGNNPVEIPEVASLPQVKSASKTRPSMSVACAKGNAVRLTLNNAESAVVLGIYDARGRIVMTIPDFSSAVMTGKMLASGAYSYVCGDMKGDARITGKFVMQ